MKYTKSVSVSYKINDNKPGPTFGIFRIFAGPTGLVWAVLYNGKVIVRTGIQRDLPTGEHWVEVTPPGEKLKIVQLSVGTNAVW